MTNKKIIIIGAGPAGLATALLLAQQGWQVEIYERAAKMNFSDANSYPIGINLRGKRTLQAINPKLLQTLSEQGRKVAGFEIRSGTKTVAKLKSGTILATTRARLNALLYERAQIDPLIKIHLAHTLQRVDFQRKELIFNTQTGQQKQVNATLARVISADGANSVARAAMLDKLPDFKAQMRNWGVHFRVLFSATNASSPQLNPDWHHIFTAKGIYTATLPNNQWLVAVTALAHDPQKELLLSDKASTAAVEALKTYITKNAPAVAELLADSDYQEFFTRKAFTGKVVRCSHLNAAEWLVLVGDAAHSVIPPTGEGVNAALEDALILSNCLNANSPTPFFDYNRKRLPDLSALGEYAWELMLNISSNDPQRAATNVCLRILGAMLSKFGFSGSQVEKRLFAEQKVYSYQQAISPWIRFQKRFRPPVDLIVGKARKLFN